MILLLLGVVASAIPSSKRIPPVKPSSTASCSTASNALLWFLETAENCTSTQPPPFCQQLDPDAFFRPNDTDQLRMLEGHLEKYGLSWLAPDLVASLDQLLAAQMSGGGSSTGRAATLGEVAHTLGRIAKGWAAILPNRTSAVRSSTFWGVWTGEWMAAAQEVLEGYSMQPSSWALLRAANYYFIAQQPFPISPMAQEAFTMSYQVLFWHLQAAGIDYANISIPYVTDDGISVLLPGIVVSPPSRREDGVLPPLVLQTSGGLDWPLPGEVVRSLYAYLDEGFMVLIYEGPGQGRTLYDPVHPLRFTHRWDRVLRAVANFTWEQLPDVMLWNQSLGITSASESLGGFLMTQACAHIDSALVQGCLIDPATPSFAFSINYGIMGRFLALYDTVDPKMLNSMCGSECSAFVANYLGVNDTHAPRAAIFGPDPLMSVVTAPSCPLGNSIVAKILFRAVHDQPGGMLLSDLLYPVLSLVPPSSDTYTDLDDLLTLVDTRPDLYAELLLHGVRILQSWFVTEAEVAATEVVVAAFSSSQDFAYESPATSTFFATLPSTSQLVHKHFDGASGAALHNEAGAWTVAWPYYLEAYRRIAALGGGVV